MTITTISTPQMVEVIQNSMVVEVYNTTGIISTIDSTAGGTLPVGGIPGQVLKKTEAGNEWSSLEDFTGWFENQLL